MSIDGARSSGGDGYQTMVAFTWALRMLHDPKITDIQIDTTSLDPAGEPIAVDDIVIHYADGNTVYCQCKKNEGDFAAWNFPDLKAELVKAGGLLARDPKAHVIFYSRNNFGKVQKLHDHARYYSDNAAFLQSLKHQGGEPPKKQKSEREETLASLASIWHDHLSATNSNVLDFLKRITFETTPNVETLRERELGTLRLHVTQAESAFIAITDRIDSIARRNTPTTAPTAIALAQRLERTDLLTLLASCGAQVTPPRQEAELQQAFRQASAVGRNWRRKIGNRQLPRAALGTLLTAIAAKPQTVVISDGPGFGKTCLLLDLVEHLEASPTHACLFVQGREFAGCKTEAERIANGFLADVAGTVARMAEYRHTIVVIDSLDVLSLAQDHHALNYFLNLIDRLQHCKNVCVVAACRSFDLKYDTRLLERSWGQEMPVGPLDWDIDILPLLQEWGVQAATLSDALKALLPNPRLLDLFGEIVRRGESTVAASEQELTGHYLHTVVSRNAALGQTAMAHIERLSQIMLKTRQLDIPLVRANLPEHICAQLLSEGVLSKTTRGNITFGHQTLLDVLAVNAAEHAGDTLLDFITRQAATPFVRPSIRAFFFHLRRHDSSGFRAQFRAALAANNVAFHIMRLLCESLAETIPDEADSGLIQNLFREDEILFDTFYRATNHTDWFDFLRRHWLPQIIAEQNATWVGTYAETVSGSKNEQPAQTIVFWLQALAFDWVDQQWLAISITKGLHDNKVWDTVGMRELLTELLKRPRDDHYFLNEALCNWIEATNSGDDLLWYYIMNDIPDRIDRFFPWDGHRYCGPSIFHDESFLGRRMSRSEKLLDLAVNAIEDWSSQIAGYYPDTNRLRSRSRFLRVCAPEGEEREESEALSRVDGWLKPFLLAIQEACLIHANDNTTWWQKMAHQLATSQEGALRDIALKAFVAHPTSNIHEIAALFADKELLASHFGTEIAKLISVAVPLLAEPILHVLQSNLVILLQDNEDDEQGNAIGIKKLRGDLIAAIPTNLRTPQTQVALDHFYKQCETEAMLNSNYPLACVPASSVTREMLMQLSDTELHHFLKQYADQTSHGCRTLPSDTLASEITQIANKLKDAASRDPERYLSILGAGGHELAERFRLALMVGAGNHLHYRFTDQQRSDKNWAPITIPKGGDLAAIILTELENNLPFWKNHRQAVSALEGCALVVEDSESAERFVSVLNEFVTAPSVNSASNNNEPLMLAANMSPCGSSAVVAIIFACRWCIAGKPLLSSLKEVLGRFATNPHPVVRAAILRELPSLQYYLPEFGWRLLDLVTDSVNGQTWREAKRCLQYACHLDFARGSRYLTKLEKNMDEDSGGIWGSISALACLAGQLPLMELSAKLKAQSTMQAWAEAALVFASNAHNIRFQDTCHRWLADATTTMHVRDVVCGQLDALFKENSPPPMIPPKLLRAFFEVRTAQGKNHSRLEFSKWLLARAENFPGDALEAIEIMLQVSLPSAINKNDSNYAKLLTCLFREGEELELTDGGRFLVRTIAVQDMLLLHEVHPINEWLQDAERK